MTVRQVLTKILNRENKVFSDNSQQWKNETIQNKLKALYTRLQILFPCFCPYDISRPIYDFETFMARFDLPVFPNPINQVKNDPAEETDSTESNSLALEPTQGTQSVDHTAPLSKKYQQELNDILAMYWFSFMKYCLEGHVDGKDNITNILNDIGEILTKASESDGKFHGRSNRSNRITYFFQKNAQIPEIMCLREYFRTADNIYTNPDIINMTPEDVTLAISKHEKIRKFTDYTNVIIEKYSDLISDCKEAEFDQNYFPDILENAPLDYELSNDEEALIKLVFKILPDDELFSQLREDHWELISNNHCKKLITCIRKLRKNPDVFVRYVGGLHIGEYETKADEIEEKLLYPYQYRIERKFEQIQLYAEQVCSESTNHFELREFEQHLDDLLAAIPPTKPQKFKSITEQLEASLGAKAEFQGDSTQSE